MECGFAQHHSAAGHTPACADGRVYLPGVLAHVPSSSAEASQQLADVARCGASAIYSDFVLLLLYADDPTHAYAYRSNRPVPAAG